MTKSPELVKFYPGSLIKLTKHPGRGYEAIFFMRCPPCDFEHQFPKTVDSDFQQYFLALTSTVTHENSEYNLGEPCVVFLHPVHGVVFIESVFVVEATGVRLSPAKVHMCPRWGIMNYRSEVAHHGRIPRNRESPHEAENVASLATGVLVQHDDVDEDLHRLGR